MVVQIVLGAHGVVGLFDGDGGEAQAMLSGQLARAVVAEQMSLVAALHQLAPEREQRKYIALGANTGEHDFGL